MTPAKPEVSALPRATRQQASEAVICPSRVRPRPRPHHADMFVVSEAEATAIRTAFDQGGEFAAAVELRRLFPSVTDNAQARECARTIAGWKPLPVTYRDRRRSSQ